MIFKYIQILFLLLFLSFKSNYSNCQISEQRKFELDSITSFIPKHFLPNLDSIHMFLHNSCNTDEERIWVFYGYLAIYFKYDDERAHDYKAPDFSPQFTAQRKKGVCRDYARVLEYLCKKSKIPCLIVTGKAPEKIFVKINKKIHRISTKTNHQWNIIYYNNSWHLMDPTWSKIEHKTKGKIWNKKTKQYDIYTISKANRTYFDVTPNFMAKTHAPIHPAFLLLDTIPSYKSLLKKDRKHKLYATNYKFNEHLDSILKIKYPAFTTKYNNETLSYSTVSELKTEYFYLLSESKWKNARYFNPSIAYYDERIQFVKDITLQIKKNTGIDFEMHFFTYEKEMLSKREKLRVKLEKEAKKKTKKKN